jgi:hypothetical protein
VQQATARLHAERRWKRNIQSTSFGITFVPDERLPVTTHVDHCRYPNLPLVHDQPVARRTLSQAHVSISSSSSIPRSASKDWRTATSSLRPLPATNIPDMRSGLWRGEWVKISFFALRGYVFDVSKDVVSYCLVKCVEDAVVLRSSRIAFFTYCFAYIVSSDDTWCKMCLSLCSLRYWT